MLIYDSKINLSTQSLMEFVPIYSTSRKNNNVLKHVAVQRLNHFRFHNLIQELWHF